jgi:N-acylglucosamine-6-phosphate 2-epimerase
LTIPVLLEGHITNPEEVHRALDLGATAVVVGSAITRPETITARFVEAAQGLSKNALAQSKKTSV